jgi:uncharacterized protein (TIGR01244 family)
MNFARRETDGRPDPSTIAYQPHQSLSKRVQTTNFCNKALALSLAVLPFQLYAATPRAPGVPHFHQVNQNLYRGGQPSADGWKSLAALGVKTVIDLRRENEDGEHSTAAERRAVEAAGMRYVHVPMKGAPSAPTDDQILKVLGEFRSDEPVFVHCKKGKDRTGTVIACYRIARDGWQNDRALDEAKSFGMHWYEFGMKGYIRSFAPARDAATAATN